MPEHPNLSSEERPLGMRARRDLVIQESVFQGETCWIIKDPVAMKYFRLREPEYIALQELYGRTSYHEIRTLLTRRFPEFTTRIEQVQQLVVSLHQNGLLITDATGQSLPLQRRRDKEIRNQVLSFGARIIAIRFPGVDPERFLQWMYPKCRWLFSWWFTLIVGLTVLAAVGLVLTHVDEFIAKLPEYQRFFAFDNLALMAVLLMVTKSIHELGHGLMCKHFGGECHQIGFMLLVMTPAMYCDTSDSWTLPNRWHRMAIGAAGMYVEIFLAAICTLVWWFTNPGWIHYLALNVMFLSSISTIIFNANPLLRYDGYYVLSDFLEIPNLAAKARMALVSKLRVVCLGLPPVNARQLPERHQVLFAIYSVASFVYRMFVIAMILWFMSTIFEPLGLAPLGHLLIAVSLATMVFIPIYKSAQYLRYPGRLRKMNRMRFSLTLASLAITLAVICLYPTPHYVWSSFVVRLRNSQMLVLHQPGLLQHISVQESEPVVAGEAIAKFSNPELVLELEELRGRAARLENDVAALELSGSLTLASAQNLAETNAQLRSIEKQIEIKDRQLDQLVIRATRGGVLFAPGNTIADERDELTLAVWSGTPLERKNMGSMMEANTLLGMVGGESEMEAILVISQSDIKLIDQGQPVVLLTEQFRNEYIPGQISSISQEVLTALPRELSQTYGGPVPVAPNRHGGEKPALKSYEAYTAISSDVLAAAGLRLLPGMRGTARIRVGSSTIGSRILRYFNGILKF